MNKLVHKFASILTLSVLAACSSNRDLHLKLVQNVKDGNYPEAIKITNDKDFYNEERNRLLKEVETASTQYYAGNYYQALQSFDNAKHISDELYTKSISSQIASILNDTNSEFSGNIYERSQIRLYQALCHYNLAIAGKNEAYTFVDEDGKVVNIPEQILSAKDKQNHINATRNIMKEWHSLFAQYQAETSGKPTYKADLMQALFGAFLYTQSGTSTDRQIALGLYREAKETLFYNYNIYPAFNEKYEAFINNYSKFDSMNTEAIKSLYVKPTQYAINLQNFIDSKINQLNAGKDDNLFIMFKEGFIADKKAKEYKLNLKSEDILLLTDLAGILAAAGGGNVGGAEFATFAASTLLNNAVYELPEIEPQDILDVKGELFDYREKKIMDLPIILASPLSNIAYKDISEKIPGEKAKLITKLTTEYVTAAAAAYITYREMKEQTNEFVALLSALGVYAGSAALIENTNEADIRQWKLLPNNIYISSVSVPNGKYTIRLSITDKNGKTSLYNKEIEVKDGKTFIDLNI